MVVHQGDAIGGDGVDVGRANLVRAVERDVVEAEIVANDKDDVRWA